MSVEWDWMLRAAVEQAVAEEIDRDAVSELFQDLISENYGVPND